MFSWCISSGQTWTAKALIILRISADWSAPSLSVYKIIRFITKTPDQTTWFHWLIWIFILLIYFISWFGSYICCTDEHMYWPFLLLYVIIHYSPSPTLNHRLSSNVRKRTFSNLRWINSNQTAHPPRSLIRVFGVRNLGYPKCAQ